MPTYEYTCAKCGKDFELFQSIKDNPLRTCPKTSCRMKKWGKGRIRRKLGAGGGFLFKGSGFYITDYRSEGYRKAAKKEQESSSPKAESKKPDAAKDDTKPKPAKKAE